MDNKNIFQYLTLENIYNAYSEADISQCLHALKQWKLLHLYLSHEYMYMYLFVLNSNHMIQFCELQKNLIEPSQMTLSLSDANTFYSNLSQLLTVQLYHL